MSRKKRHARKRKAAALPLTCSQAAIKYLGKRTIFQFKEGKGVPHTYVGTVLGVSGRTDGVYLLIGEITGKKPDDRREVKLTELTQLT